jgi:cell division protein ZapB
MNRGPEYDMDTTKSAGIDAAAERLETLVSRLMERCASLHEENRLLHDQLRQARADRAAAKERTEQARHRVEGMIARLRTMEHPE